MMIRGARMKRPDVKERGVGSKVGPHCGLLGTAAAVLLLVGSVHAQSEPSPGDTPPATTARQIEALLVRKAQRTPAQRKVSSQLLDARQSGQSQPAAVVTVDIRADVTPAVLARIQSSLALKNLQPGQPLTRDSFRSAPNRARSGRKGRSQCLIRDKSSWSCLAS